VTGDGAITTDANKVLTIAGSTVTASDPVLSLGQTWNNSGTTFTALSLTVTSSASAAGSLLANFLSGTTSEFNVDESGDVMAQGIMNAANAGGGYKLNISAYEGGGYPNQGLGFPSGDSTPGASVTIAGDSPMANPPSSAAYSNAVVGYGAGNSLTTSAIDNTGIGGVYNLLSSGYANTEIGGVANGASSAYGMVGVGFSALGGITTACCGVMLGDNAG
jgi:hypothetical protein